MRIRRDFGAEMIDEQGNLDRAAMSTLVFSNPEARKHLEEINPSCCRKLTKHRLKELSKQGRRVAVVDVPLLFEKKLDCDVRYNYIGVCISLKFSEKDCEIVTLEWNLRSRQESSPKCP